jgi:uncharacterized repeat protein (TIGR01451 family)
MSSNIWNSPQPITYTYNGSEYVNYLGNYWSDYSGTDTNNDGIGDVSYSINSENDYYPLMQPFETYSQVPSTTKLIMEEITSRTQASTETIISQNATLNTTVTGDFNAVLNFTNLEIVLINSGSFAGKGFSKGNWSTNIEGNPYEGSWQGMLFKKPEERKIYLKGMVSGGLKGIVEGFLSESVNGSDIYDQYQTTWTINHIGANIVFAKLNLNGTVNYQESVEYSSELYALQTLIQGHASGYYDCSLGVVLTHVRIDNTTNPYYGQGFSIISYTAEFGSGEGWTYDKITSPKMVEMNGLFADPLRGIISGKLDESGPSRTLSIAIERMNIGLPPEEDLKVTVWGPKRVSPGQTVNYIVEYRNDGLKAAEDVFIVKELSSNVTFVSASGDYYYSPISHEVSWHLAGIPAKTSGLLTVQANVSWGMPGGALIEDPAYIVQGKKFNNIYLPGIGWSDGDLPGIADFGREFGGRYTLTYKDTVFDPKWHPFQTADTLKEVYMAYRHIPTARNGLAWDWGNAHYDVAIAYSGGTRTLISLLQEGRIAADTVVLVSPQLISQQELEDIVNNQVGGVKRIIVYQSDADYCFHFTQQRVLYDGELVWETTIFDVDTGWICVLPIPVFYVNGVPIEDSLFVGRDRENGLFLHSVGRIEAPDIWNGIEHEDMANHLKELLLREQLDWAQPVLYDVSDEFTSIIAPAHDPNIKYGPQGYVSPDQTLNYTVECENEGEGIAFGVYFTDTLDEDLDTSNLEIGPVISTLDGSIIADPGTYNPSTRTITWLVGEVGPGEGGYANFSAKVRNDAPEGTEIINYATVYFPSVPETTRTNAIVSVVGQPNIAVTNVTPSEFVIEKGSTQAIDVTVANKGYFPETFNLTLYANATAIQTQNVTLLGRNSDIITFLWNTTGFSSGNYTISAYATPLPSETNTADNTYTDGTVQILQTYTLTITTTAGGTTDPAPGTYTYTANSSVQATAIPNADHVFDHWELDSINVGSSITYIVLMDKNHTLQAAFYIIGDINRDGTVDIKDLVLFVKAFGSYPTHTRWNPKADLNNDEKADIKDLILLVKHFGEHYP